MAKRMLHLVTRSPFMRNECRTTFRLARGGDGVLFLQDGVVAAGGLPADLWAQTQKLRSQGVRFYVLKEDLDARALKLNTLGAQLVDYDELLELFGEYDLLVP
jgi:sulfur relay protein TusB/DsrH